MAVMLRPAEASHACKVKFVRLKGSPEAKLRNRTAVMRLSPSACSKVGFFAAAVKRKDSTSTRPPSTPHPPHTPPHPQPPPPAPRRPRAIRLTHRDRGLLGIYERM